MTGEEPLTGPARRAGRALRRWVRSHQASYGRPFTRKALGWGLAICCAAILLAVLTGA